MPLESASYVSQLEASNPASTDLLRQADDHIRLIKAVLKATFPNISGAVSATHTQLNQSSPAGLIALWYGSSASIPAGWVLCNGANGTPNLTDRFVIGAGTIAAQGATAGAAAAVEDTAAGGAHSHTLSGGAHDHTATIGGTALTVSQIPAHDHGLAVAPMTVDAGGSATFTNISAAGSTSDSYISDRGSGATHDHTATIASSASHDHTVADSATHTHEVAVATIPPCLGLHYIMRT